MVAGALASALLFGGPPPSKGHPSYVKANELFVARKFPEALAAVEEALRLDPNLVPALTLRAKLAMAANRYDIARQSLERALAVDPDAPYAQFLYGMEAYMNNDMQAALTRFRRARQLAPKDPRVALYLGLTTESLGQPLDALALYEEAIRLERKTGQPQSETLLPGARLLLLLGRLDESERWIRDAVKLSPNLRDAHFELARLLLKKGEPAQAASEGELALSLSEGVVTDTAIHYLLGRAWQQAGMPDRAAAHTGAIRAQENATAGTSAK
jgi:tetratricopeptide (TPR) repeat protein